MRLKIYSFLTVFFFLLATMTFCAPQEKETKAEKLRENIIQKMKMKEGMEVNKKMMASLADRIIEDNESLKRYFSEENYVDMAQLLKARKAIIVTPEYQRIFGQDSAFLWKTAWKKEAKLKFETVIVYISDVMGLQTIQMAKTDAEGKMSVEETNVDSIAFVLQEIHIITEREGAAPQNESFFASSCCMHREVCPWY